MQDITLTGIVDNPTNIHVPENKMGIYINPTENGYSLEGIDSSGTTHQLSSSSGVGDMEYTINGQSADEDGNFTVNASSFGASMPGHTHNIDQVIDLQTSLNNKSNVGHTHELVSGIKVGSQVLTGSDIELVGSINTTVTSTGQIINLDVLPYTSDITDALDINGDTVKFFIGTEQEWSEFTAEANTKYIVYITE